eukprot:6537490-Prymnesium_polylepis.1
MEWNAPQPASVSAVPSGEGTAPSSASTSALVRRQSWLAAFSPAERTAPAVSAAPAAPSASR